MTMYKYAMTAIAYLSEDDYFAFISPQPPQTPEGIS